MLKFIVIFVLTVVNPCVVTAKLNLQVVSRQSAPDLPLKEDLDNFLKPIETLTNYVVNNVTVIDVNFALGLFFTNVHLGRVMLDKSQKMPIKFLTRIEDILDTNEKSLLRFHREIKNAGSSVNRDHVIISGLFVYSSYWIDRLKKFKYEEQPAYQMEDLQNIYSVWNNYTDNVDKVYQWNPSPKNSDMCLVTLAINGKNKRNSSSWCPVANICYNILTHGTNFGYALCHRLAVLLMAELGRGCFILSVREDEELKQKICTMAYAEAEYIAMNDYGIADLMLEIMCLCATDGRVQVLRRSWLYKMFDFQNANGCFGKEYSLPEQSRKTNLDVCNSHTTSLASGSYAAAVRFILEYYY